MRCDEVLVNLRTLEPAAPGLAEHLAACSRCREAASRTAHILDDVKEVWGPEEVPPDAAALRRELEGLAMIDSFRRFRIVHLAAAAVVLVAVVLGVRWMLASDRTGPRFPAGGGLPVALPALGIEPPSRWFDLETAALLLAGPDGLEIRTTYDLADGGPRVRSYDADAGTWPEPDGDDPVAIVLAADGSTPWWSVAPTAFDLAERTGHGELWLAGTDRAGGLAAVPLMVDVPRVVLTLGANLTPIDIGSPVIEVRVTHERGGVRYRFGLIPTEDRPDPYAGGDVWLTADEAALGYVASLAPLRDFLALEGRPDRRPSPSVVYLESDDRARVVDVLRAVECAEAGSSPLFFIRDEGYEDWEPVRPGPAGRQILREDRGRDPWPRLVVNVTRDGRLIMKREMWTVEQVLETVEACSSGLLLRADARAPWRVCAPLWNGSRHFAVAFGREAGLPFERVLDDPASSAVGVDTEPGGEVVTVTVSRAAEGHLVHDAPEPPRLAGKVLELTVPEDARAGEVLALALELHACGAGILFR